MLNKKSYFLIILLLSALLLSVYVALINKRGNTPEATPPQVELPQDKNGNFILYVSNQSFAIDPVDIEVSIDGKVAVNQEFMVKGQHNWIEFRFSLDKGDHKILMKSEKGDSLLEKEFTITDKHWAVVNYWYYPNTHYMPVPKHFSFDIQDTPLSFM